MQDNNPYTPPNADLVNVAMPDSFTTASISAEQLNAAGWLTIFYAFLTLPILALSVMGAQTGDDATSTMLLVLEVVSSALWIYLIIVLKRFVHARFSVSGLDPYVALLIFFTVIMSVLSFFMDRTENANEFSTETIAFFLTFLPYGIVTVLFGRKLLSIDVPYPYLKAFTWLIIATGISMATIVLFILIIPLGIVADILLAMLFFSGKKELATGVNLSNIAAKQRA